MAATQSKKHAKRAVKIFTAGDVPDGFPHLEDQINKWLDEHPEAVVIERLMSTAIGHSATRGLQRNNDGCFINVTISLFYEVRVTASTP